MKVKSPLFSLAASGSICKFITFSERKTGSQVRWQNKQKDKITTARQAQRAKFLTGREMWNVLDVGICECGFTLLGGQDVKLISLPSNARAPQFARFVGDVMKYYF